MVRIAQIQRKHPDVHGIQRIQPRKRDAASREAQVLASLNHPNTAQIYRLRAHRCAVVGIVSFPVEDIPLVNSRRGRFAMGPLSAYRRPPVSIQEALPSIAANPLCLSNV